MSDVSDTRIATDIDTFRCGYCRHEMTRRELEDESQNNTAA